MAHSAINCKRASIVWLNKFGQLTTTWCNLYTYQVLSVRKHLLHDVTQMQNGHSVNCDRFGLQKRVGTGSRLKLFRRGANSLSRSTLTRKLLSNVACASVSSLLSEVPHSIDCREISSWSLVALWKTSPQCYSDRSEPGFRRTVGCRTNHLRAVLRLFGRSTRQRGLMTAKDKTISDIFHESPSPP